MLKNFNKKYFILSVSFIVGLTAFLNNFSNINWDRVMFWTKEQVKESTPLPNEYQIQVLQELSKKINYLDQTKNIQTIEEIMRYFVNDKAIVYNSIGIEGPVEDNLQRYLIGLHNSNDIRDSIIVLEESINYFDINNKLKAIEIYVQD